MIVNLSDIQKEIDVDGITLGDSLTTSLVPLRVNYSSGVPFVRRSPSGTSLEPTTIKNGAIASAVGFFGASQPSGFSNAEGANLRITLPSSIANFISGNLTRDSNSEYLTKRVFWVRVSAIDLGYDYTYTCNIYTYWSDCNKADCNACGQACGSTYWAEDKCTYNGVGCDYWGNPAFWIDRGAVEPCTGIYHMCSRWACSWDACNTCVHGCYETRSVPNGCWAHAYSWSVKYARYYSMNGIWWNYDLVDVSAGSNSTPNY